MMMYFDFVFCILRRTLYFAAGSQPGCTGRIQTGPTGEILLVDCSELQPGNTNKQTVTSSDRTFPHAVVGTRPSPESRVDADVVRLREGRCAPPVAGGRREEVLLILRLHLQRLSVRLFTFAVSRFKSLL